jgi:UDP-N-acetylglucosamine diphosphorylase / glucose-1-phosphate thymidylyltransferase / UDP-N-acetylgalactosamine diphosphorylase / glucosamine-1-phosphate N-acetyltransferase / galactosamine-1-phosphate N-acetyltransferase
MKISEFVSKPAQSLADMAPWNATTRAADIIGDWIAHLPDGYAVNSGIAIHHSSQVETGAILKAPVLIGPNCFVAAGAYLRGGVWLEGEDIIGPYCEVKSSFMFSHSKIAHLSFVGDSIIGRDVNIEAGAMIANYRNEKPDKQIRFRHRNVLIDTGVDKFGAVLGDGTRIGANAVIAPGAALAPNSIVKRLELIDYS